MTASAVNALGTMRSLGGEKQVIDLHVYVGEKEFYRRSLNNLRAVEKENPEVMDDR